ncbi:MAG: ATP-binding protein [Methanobacteriaceae archaeon]|jgi:nucleolar protein 56|nr:ATP-binding protein [Candidatus Methanorudis spinitermitis]
MESYISHCIAGFIAFDKNHSIINYKLFKEEEIPLKIVEINQGKLLSEEKELIENIPDDYDTIVIESSKMISKYNELKNYEKIHLEIPNPGGEYLRENLNDILTKLEFSHHQELKSKLIKNFTRIATLKMKESSQEGDKLIIHAINSIDELDESISKLIERIREWYTIYFPELDIIQNNENYISLIAENGIREEIIANNTNSFKLDIDISNGADIENEDLEMIIDFAKSIQFLQKSRKSIEKYIDSKMDKIAPNLKNLVGASLGGKLIAHVGSVKKLATYPSGTIQIMGAEKALFRHLKTGERPPKHGLIFQHPEVRTSPWWVRGKIARTLALKISLSVRKDVFTGDFDPKIGEDFLEKVEKIKKDNPFPKKTKKRRKEEKKDSYSKKSRKHNKKKFKKKKRKK